MKAIAIANIVIPNSDGNKPTVYEPGVGKHLFVEPWVDNQPFEYDTLCGAGVIVTDNNAVSDNFRVVDLEGKLSDKFPDYSTGGLLETLSFTTKSLSGDKKILAAMSGTNSKLYIYSLVDQRLIHIIDMTYIDPNISIALNTDGSKVWVKIGTNDIVEVLVASESTSLITDSNAYVDMIYNPTTNSLILANSDTDKLNLLDITSGTLTEIAGTSFATLTGDQIFHRSDDGKYIIAGSYTDTDPIAVLLTSNNTVISGIDSSLKGRVYPGPLNTFTTINSGKVIVSKIVNDTTVEILYSSTPVGVGTIGKLFGLANIGEVSVTVPFTVSADDSIFKVITRDSYTGDIVSYMFANTADTVNNELKIYLHSQQPVDVEISGIHVEDRIPGKSYTVGDIITAPDTNYKWRCITAGSSEATETIRFDMDIDVTDGTCVWTKDNAIVKPMHYTRLIPIF